MRLRASCKYDATVAKAMLLGAHHTIAGGHHNSVAEAIRAGSECMQIFCKNQRQWNAKPIESAQAQAFQDAVREAELGPTMVHDSYLINMGTPDAEKRTRAVAAFADELERCEALGVQFLNFHPGSHTHASKAKRDDPGERRACLDRIAAGMHVARDAVPGDVLLVIENAAGQGTNVGTNWEELDYLAEAYGEKVGICIDTQHAWACGYDWVGDYDAVWDRFDDQVGLQRLVAFHLNDSKQPLGARVDRHDNIPTGHLGGDFWQRLMQDRRFDSTCGYLETPLGPDGIATYGRELAYLKQLRAGGSQEEALEAHDSFQLLA